MSPRTTTDDHGRDGARRHQARQSALRLKAARIIRIVFGVLATILALGALLVVLRANINEDNAVVQLVTDVAETISGPFSRENGVFDFEGKNAESKNALLNWGIAAVVYLAIGRLLAGAITPKAVR